MLKNHEEMITENDSYNTVDLGNYYAILPSSDRNAVKRYCKITKGKKVKDGFSYNSGTNPNFLTIKNLRLLIKEQIDSSFEPA